MAPVDYLYRLKNSYFGHHEDHPIISTTTAASLSVAFILLYVLPFYLSPTTRPSPTLNRDAPSVIRARIRTVTLACIISSTSTLYPLLVTAKWTPSEALHMLGYWPVHPAEVGRCCLLTFVLFLGPLFELVFVDGVLGDLKGGRLLESLSSWQGYRNYVAGPITEEVLFRSVLIPIHLLAKIPPINIVFLTPLYFGIAHVHHYYEFRLTHPHTPLLPAILRSVFQFGYTSVFGWLAAFIYVRTASIWPCIIIHTFCNSVGLPRFWGKLSRREEHPHSPIMMRGKDDADVVQSQGNRGDLGIQWTIAYYVLLFLGAYGFYAGLWPMTVSSQALVDFS